MKLQKSNSNLLKPENCQQGDIVKIIGEFSYKEGNQGTGYLNFKVEMQDGTHKLAGINDFHKDKFIEQLGPETDHWIGEELMVSIATSKNSGKEYVVLKPLTKEEAKDAKDLEAALRKDEKEISASDIPF